MGKVEVNIEILKIVWDYFGRTCSSFSICFLRQEINLADPDSSLLQVKKKARNIVFRTSILTVDFWQNNTILNLGTQHRPSELNSMG